MGASYADSELLTQTNLGEGGSVGEAGGPVIEIEVEAWFCKQSGPKGPGFDFAPVGGSLAHLCGARE